MRSTKINNETKTYLNENTGISLYWRKHFNKTLRDKQCYLKLVD